MSRRTLAVAAIAVVLLAGCSAEPAAPAGPANPAMQQPDNNEISVVEVKVGQKTVTCVFWDGYKTSGLDCDWSNAK